MMAKVEGMPLAALEHGIDWGWETFADYLGRLEGNVAVNAGFLVGHCAIRRYVMGDEAVGREATDAEIADAWPRWHAANARRVGPDPHLRVVRGRAEEALIEQTDKLVQVSDPSASSVASRSCGAQLIQLATNSITVESMADLGIQQGYDLTPMTEVPGVAFGFVLGDQLGQQVARNMVAELAKDAELPSG